MWSEGRDGVAGDGVRMWDVHEGVVRGDGHGDVERDGHGVRRVRAGMSDEERHGWGEGGEGVCGRESGEGVGGGGKLSVVVCYGAKE